MDAAGFAPVLRQSGGVRMNEQKNGREEETYPPKNTCCSKSPSRTCMNHVWSLLLFRKFFSPNAIASFFFKAGEGERVVVWLWTVG